jgi:hypothetical protein
MFAAVIYLSLCDEIKLIINNVGLPLNGGEVVGEVFYLLSPSFFLYLHASVLERALTQDK